MTVLATIGWAVVHSLWLCTLIAGPAALILSLLQDRHTRVRYRISGIALALMVVMPLVVAIGAVDVLDRGTRWQAVAAIEASVGMPAVVNARAIAVPAAAVLWIAGFAGYVTRVVGEGRRARRLRRLDLETAGEAVRATVEDLRARVRVNAAVRVFRSTRAGVPMVLGWREPVILLPSGSAARLGDDQLRAVLAHELAHVRRRDYVINLLQIGADALLFHHPAARWLSRRIRIEREYCCDDVAVAIGRDPQSYARALAALEDARGGCRLAVAAASGTLLDRIQRIVGQPRPVLTPARGAVVLVTTSLVAALIMGLVSAVPPSMPLDVKVRMRTPAPPGFVPDGPANDSLPRKRQMPGQSAPLR
jgi:beta-lactamase regulating signal transducer with metallopeptidase domain